MEVLVFDTLAQAVSRAADIIERQLMEKPASVLGLATGRTPLPLYAELLARRLDFSQAVSFNLDEYAERDTFRVDMDAALFQHTALQATHFPDADGYSHVIAEIRASREFAPASGETLASKLARVVTVRSPVSTEKLRYESTGMKVAAGTTKKLLDFERGE